MDFIAQPLLWSTSSWKYCNLQKLQTHKEQSENDCLRRAWTLEFCHLDSASRGSFSVSTRFSLPTGERLPKPDEKKNAIPQNCKCQQSLDYIASKGVKLVSIGAEGKGVIGKCTNLPIGQWACSWLPPSLPRSLPPSPVSASLPSSGYGTGFTPLRLFEKYRVK